MSLCRIGHVSVAVLPPSAYVEEAVHLMSERSLGSVVIAEAGRPIGIVTDRDLVLRVLAAGLNPAGTRVSEVMSEDLVTVHDDCAYDEAAWRMREHRVRRLPVVGPDGQLIGIISLDDLLGKVGGLRMDVAEILASFHAPYQAV